MTWAKKEDLKVFGRKVLKKLEKAGYSASMKISENRVLGGGPSITIETPAGTVKFPDIINKKYGKVAITPSLASFKGKTPRASRVMFDGSAASKVAKRLITLIEKLETPPTPHSTPVEAPQRNHAVYREEGEVSVADMSKAIEHLRGAGVALDRVADWLAYEVDGHEAMGRVGIRYAKEGSR